MDVKPSVAQDINTYMTLKRNMMGRDTIEGLVDFYKLFSDNSRLKILYALSMCEVCVNDLSLLLDMNQSAVSHQLQILRRAQLVKYRRQGKSIFYRLDDDHIGQILLQGLLHLGDI